MRIYWVLQRLSYLFLPCLCAKQADREFKNGKKAHIIQKAYTGHTYGLLLSRPLSPSCKGLRRVNCYHEVCWFTFRMSCLKVMLLFGSAQPSICRHMIRLIDWLVHSFVHSLIHIFIQSQSVKNYFMQFQLLHFDVTLLTSGKWLQISMQISPIIRSNLSQLAWENIACWTYKSLYYLQCYFFTVIALLPQQVTWSITKCMIDDQCSEQSRRT
jgi:hypothetical protein